jgi:mRNA-decapping enzyme subunit 2
MSSDKSHLLARFIVPLPDKEYKDRNRLLYHVLQAQWYRERYMSGSTCPPPKRAGSLWTDALSLQKFGRWLMGREDFPFTGKEVADFYRNYYYMIPVCGAIIYRDASRREWLTVKSPWARRIGFPKGKVNNGESDKDCACREVHEETGLSIAHLIHDDSTPRIEYHQNKRRRLSFFVVTLDKESELSPENNYEISQVQWTPCDTPIDNYVKDSQEAIRQINSSSRPHE